MSYLGFYLLTKLDDFGAVLFVISILCFIAFAIIFIPSLMCSVEAEETRDEFVETMKKLWVFKVFWTGVICLTIATVLPTTKQAAFIWIAPQIVENGAVKDTVKNIPELTKLGTDYLKELLKEKVNG